nr:Clp protease N-terminal domain-containing protein [Caballeronia sp. Lep1P3]
MPHLCDVCGARPATVRLAVLRDGRRHVLDVCDFHYAQLTRHQRALSPFEALFASGDAGQPAAPAERVSAERATGAEGVGLERYLSDGAKEMLMRAAERAVQFGRAEVDTEHLLYELADNAVIQSMLKSIGIDARDIRSFIDANAERREGAPPPARGMIGVSPRLKARSTARSSRRGSFGTAMSGRSIC